jgi:hypothetical protein
LQSASSRCQRPRPRTWRRRSHDRFTRQALLIDEDDALADAVVQRMISAGLPVITSVSE